METYPFSIGHRKRTKARFMKADERTFEDYEILEMILYNAIPRADTKVLAKSLLRKFGSLLAVLNAPAADLKKHHGLGEAVIFQFKLMNDFFSRLLVPVDAPLNILSNWNAVIGYCQLTLAYKQIEYFRILFLNRKNVLIADEICQKGTVDHVEIYPREVAKKAIEHNCSSVILVHNHPSGDPNPSKKDIELTNNIIKVLQPLDIQVHDHIVIAGHRHFSFKGSGLI